MTTNESQNEDKAAIAFFDGIQAIQAKQWHAAHEALAHAVDLESFNASAHYYLGTTLAALEKPVEAIEAYKKALILEPSMPAAYNHLGLAHRETGNLEEAVRAFEQALVRDPNDVQAHNNLGVTLWELGQLEEALQEYQSALELKRNYATVYGNLGVALRDQERVHEAIAMLRQARRLDGRNPYVAKNYGLTLLLVGQRAPARRTLRRAQDLASALISEKPGAAGPRLLLASVLLGLDREPETLTIVRQIVSEAPLAYGPIKSCLRDCELFEGLTEADECAALLRQTVSDLRTWWNSVSF